MKVGKGINKMSLVPGFFSGDLTAHICHRKSRLHYRMAFVKEFRNTQCAACTSST